MLSSLPLRGPRWRVLSLLVTTSLLFGLLLVSAPGVDAGRGGCKVTNDTSGKTYAGLTRAISTATSGDTLSIIETCWGSFTIDKDLTLQGDPTATLQGTGRARVLEILAGATVTLTDLTITGGAESGDAGFGGGIWSSGTLTLDDSTVSGNTATSDGGGIYNDQGTVTLTGSTVSGNTAASDFGGSGGGIWNEGGTVTLTGSTVSGNTAAFLGGGIHNNSGFVTLSNSTVGANNTAVFGGGIWNEAGTITLSGTSSVTGNTALVPEHGGGGIYNALGTISPSCAAVTGNTPDDCYDYVPEP